MIPRKLPVGIQDFPYLREEGYLYVDKTELVWRLANEGKVYFMSKPRRFGKSLLLSTIGAYLEGRRELFSGLAIESLEQSWTAYPVLRLDLNAENYTDVAGLESILTRHLVQWESMYGSDNSETTVGGRFSGIIRRAHENTGQRVVVLVDEYDKPLLETLGKPEIHQEYKAILKAFYGVLKSADGHLRFAMLTGVTKFGQVSVFSDLNQLMDLTLHQDYATICGITEEELLRDFQPELARLAKEQHLSAQACLEQIRAWYNGYHFHPTAPGVYNPFSTLNLLHRREFQAFWFATGTPTFLVQLLKSSNYDLRELDGVEMPAEQFADYRAEPDRPLPVIYQSGYLTIKGYDRESRMYQLGFPNDEVRYGFLHFLLPDYVYGEKEKAGFHISRFGAELKAGQVDAFMLRLKAFFAGIPYELSDRSERHYQAVFYLVFTLLGQFVEAEVRSAKGRADAVVKTQDHIYVFEFKLDGSAEEALAQIDRQEYLLPYSTDGRILVKLGVAFDAAERNIGRWLQA